MSRTPLGEWLTRRGLISADQLHIAEIEQRAGGQPLGKILTGLGFISEAALREAVSGQLGQQSVDLGQTGAEPAALQLIPGELARRLRVLPLALDPGLGRLTLALADPDNLAILDQIRLHLRHRFALEIRIASESDIALALDRHYGHELSIDGILHEIETGEANGTLAQSPASEYSQPVVRLVDALLADAVARGASDMHFEPEQGFVRIRYRIDGVLQQIRVLHGRCWPGMVVRLKVMSGMNIAETRAPQDGRISLTLGGRLLDFRASVQPTSWGENVVLRILDRQKGLVPLDGLGLTAPNLDCLRLMIARPEGMLLVTGPTGSGKTTTLYSILSHINSVGINIMTLEDPVEYPIPMIRQTSVNDAVKMDFVSGIRSMMRQDPDVILVGEIRDRETAEMAFRAAMTGHQVYSTLHTHSAIGAMARLSDLGILPDVMAGNLIGIIAQRLVRQLCPHCRQAFEAGPLERQLLGLPEGETARLYRACGCDHCNHSGYRGRIAVMELLRMTADLDELVARRAPARELFRTAKAGGFTPLIDDACDRVLVGATSLEEIARVVDLTERVH